MVYTNFNMTTLCLDNHPQSFWQMIDQSLGSVCPCFAEPRSRSELASTDQCLKFCDVTTSATTLYIQNNPRYLNLDCSGASWFNELRHIGMQVSDSVANGVHGASSCLNTKSLFEIRRIVGSKPCLSSNKHCLF